MRSPQVASQFSGFIHKRMLKGAGISIKRVSFEAKLPSGLPPAVDSSEHFMKNFLRLGGIDSKTGSGGQRAGNSRFFLTLGDGRFAHAGTIHFRHRVEIIGWRKRPASR